MELVAVLVGVAAVVVLTVWMMARRGKGLGAGPEADSELFSAGHHPGHIDELFAARTTPAPPPRPAGSGFAATAGPRRAAGSRCFVTGEPYDHCACPDHDAAGVTRP